MSPQEFLVTVATETPSPGAFERLQGLAVLGVTFESGHVLALRHFERTAYGPGFTAVWMREPNGEWHFFSTNPPRQSSARYMLPEVADQTPIELRWVDERTLHVSIKAISFRWFVEFEETRRTRFMSGVIARTPRGVLRNPVASRAVAALASTMLRAGTLRLRGEMPSGQNFAGMPAAMWKVRRSVAWTTNYNFGAMVTPGQQMRFGDFWIPATPIAVAGAMEFSPLPDAVPASLPLAA